MSLINDALKEAQRERSGRGGSRNVAPLVENIFPYPEARSSARPPLLLLGGVAIAVVLIVAIGLLVRSRMREPISAKTTPSKSVSSSSPKAVVRTAPPRIPAAEPAPVAPSNRASSVVASSATLPKAPPSPPPQSTLSRPAPAVASPVSKPAPAKPSATAPVLSQTKVPVDSAAQRSTAATSASAKSSAANPPEAPAAPRGDATTVRLVMDPAASSPADSIFRLAYAEQMKSNLDGAQALYEQAIATQHAPAEAYNDYGVLLLARGNKTAATEMFRQALNHDDKNVEAWVNLGDSFNGMGYHAEAMSAYARANQLDPARAAVKARISREYEAIGDTASARRYLDDAIKASPNDAAAHYAMGSYLQRAHDYRGAIREFQMFVDLSAAKDGQEFVGEVRRHINALKQVAP